jgi:hypothetical protein
VTPWRYRIAFCPILANNTHLARLGVLKTSIVIVANATWHYHFNILFPSHMPITPNAIIGT